MQNVKLKQTDPPRHSIILNRHAEILSATFVSAFLSSASVIITLSMCFHKGPKLWFNESVRFKLLIILCFSTSRDQLYFLSDVWATYQQVSNPSFNECHGHWMSLNNVSILYWLHLIKNPDLDTHTLRHRFHESSGLTFRRKRFPWLKNYDAMLKGRDEIQIKVNQVI